MFVLSLKTSRIRIIAVCACLGVAALLGIYAISASAVAPASAASEKSGGNYSGATNGERLDFLGSYGWEMKSDPAEVVEVVIPSEFDEVYTSYNEIQKKQNLDLTPFRGKKARRYTYHITNYPGQTGQNADIKATLLVYDDKIIGGDVSSSELNGFMHGFTYG